MALTLTYKGHSNITSQSSQFFTFAAFALGTASADRHVYISLNWHNATHRGVLGVSIGGVTADGPVGTITETTDGGGLIFHALVPTGTTGDIVIEYDGTFNATTSNGCGIDVYTVTGGGTTAPTINDSYTDATTANPSKAFTVKAGGCLIVTGNANSVSSTSSGVTADTSFVQYVAGLTGFAGHSVNSGGTDITVTWAGTNWSASSATCAKLGIAIVSAVNNVTIATALKGLTIADAVTESIPSTIATTLKAPTQSMSVFLGQPFAIAQTLKGFTQSINVTETIPSTISTTLFGLTQESDDAEVFPSTISTTLFAPTSQLLMASESIPFAIDQTLPGLTQEIDVALSQSVSIDMLLCSLGTHATALTPLSYIGTFSPLSGNPITFNSLGAVSFGTESADRWIFACITSGTIDRTFTGVTIGGIQATELTEADGNATTRPSAIFVANVPTNTDQTVVVTESGSNAMQCSLFSTTGNLDTTPVDFFIRETVGADTLGLNTRSGGVAFGIASGVTNANTFFGGDFNTLDWKNNLGGGGQGSHKSTTNDGTPLSVTVQTVGSIDTAIAVSMGAILVPATALTQELDMNVTNVVTIDQTLQGFTQEIDVVTYAGVIVQTLPKLTQSVHIVESIPTRIDQTLLGISQQNLTNLGIGLLIATALPGIVSQEIDIVEIIPTRINQTLFGISQEIDILENPIANIAQTLLGFIQTDNVIVIEPTFIDQTLIGFTQEADVVVIEPMRIDQTLSGFTQEIDVVENIIGSIDQTLSGFQQEIDINVSPAFFIDQTLQGMAQEIDIVEIIPTYIDQTLFSILQSQAVIVESVPTHIDQTLPGLISQEIDVVEIMTATIDTQLSGFSQEIDVVESIPTYIDQTLQGFMQELDAIETDPPGTIGLHIDQTLSGFSQEIDVNVFKTDISVELQGMTQRATVTTTTAHHKRGPHAAIMPSKEMPIHPGELELFRGKVYGRAIDALVPPPVTARYNLTTRQYPTSRIAVDRTPLGKKPS